MTSRPVESPEESQYAMTLASNSYEWYRTAAIRSRGYYRLSEAALLIISASIPASAAIAPGNSVVPAILGAVVVVVSGLRSVFHWQDNYLRFSGAREAIEAERRLYLTGEKPYEDLATRDRLLAAAVTRIEQDEMNAWVKIAADRPKP